ncbi:MAG: A/G-specific adenine glycosylase [Rhodothermales bacterium]
MPQTAISPKYLQAFRYDLIDWFLTVRRTLPWRESRNPYQIWISEVMLQQTRVDQALPYYERFVQHFPDVRSLAAASLDEVLHKWEGLGYYSRARNMHRAAQVVLEEKKGYLPDDYESLRKLPGIGPYTAAAIASIAFNLPHAAVDGNVIRVMARVFAVDEDARAANSRKQIEELANKLLPEDRPGDFNEAMMELGALVCTPKKPACDSCPLSGVCVAYAEDKQHIYPVKSPTRQRPHYEIAVGLIFHADRLYIQRRSTEAMLGGLWEFPGGKREEGESLEDTCRREIMEETGMMVTVEREVAKVRHAYSHFTITLHAFQCAMAPGVRPAKSPSNTAWVREEDLMNYAFPRANRKILDVLKQNGKRAE